MKWEDDMLYIGPGQNCGNVTPPTPDPNATYYVTGTAELVGADKAWNEKAIAMTKKEDNTFTHTFSDLAAGITYRMKLTNGTWDANWGFSAVQNAPAGVAGDTDGNIVFELKTKSHVTVAFNGANITLQGDFTDESPIKPVHGSSVPAQCEDVMLQAFYYTHHIPAAELAVDVIEEAPYRLSLGFDLEQDVLVKVTDESIPVKVTIDRSQGFTDNVDLVLGKKNRLFSLEPVSFKPGETEKMVFIKVNQTAMERFKGKKNKPNWQMYISGIVKGEWIRTNRGRQVQVAKYEEMTPIFNIRLKR
jgi:hypothetical protein